MYRATGLVVIQIWWYWQHMDEDDIYETKEWNVNSKASWFIRSSKQLRRGEAQKHRAVSASSLSGRWVRVQCLFLHRFHSPWSGRGFFFVSFSSVAPSHIEGTRIEPHRLPFRNLTGYEGKKIDGSSRCYYSCVFDNRVEERKEAINVEVLGACSLRYYYMGLIE
jgi:hypothetical protein